MMPNENFEGLNGSGFLAVTDEQRQQLRKTAFINAGIMAGGTILGAAGARSPGSRGSGTQGLAAQQTISDKWAKGTFGNVDESIAYHFGKHGSGRTLQQYTDDAVSFFQQNREYATWGQWNPKWEPSYRLKIGDQGGY